MPADSGAARDEARDPRTGPAATGGWWSSAADLTRAVEVPRIAPTLQAALDDWAALEPALARRRSASSCAAGREDVIRLRSEPLRAPLPRAYQCADGSAYRQPRRAGAQGARRRDAAERFWTDPLMYQGGSDGFSGPHDVAVADEAFGIDLEAEVAVITDDVPMGIAERRAATSSS